MEVKAHILDEAAVHRALVRIAHEIIERNGGNLSNVVFVGIKSRGIPLAKIISENVYKAEGIDIPVGELDISLYRDDLAEKSANPVIEQIDIKFDINCKDVVLVDDVLYTGRTVRAAIDALFSVGRPRSIQLAILVDRGHRELPLRADFVGKNLPTSGNEVVQVKIPPYEPDTAVDLLNK